MKTKYMKTKRLFRLAQTVCAFPRLGLAWWCLAGPATAVAPHIPHEEQIPRAEQLVPPINNESINNAPISNEWRVEQQAASLHPLSARTVEQPPMPAAGVPLQELSNSRRFDVGRLDARRFDVRRARGARPEETGPEDASLRNPSLRNPSSGDIRPRVTRRAGPNRTEPRNPETGAIELRDANQRGDRLSHRLPIPQSNAMLEVRAQSESFQTLQIFEIEENSKESFSLSWRQDVIRTPQSSFSISLGFAYRDEALPSSPPIERPAPLGIPGPLPPPVGPPLGPMAAPARTGLPPARPRPMNAPPPPGADTGPLANTDTGPPNVVPLNAAGGPPAFVASASNPTRIRTGVLQFAQNYRQQDETGQWLVRSQFNLGTEMASTPSTVGSDPQFLSWQGRVERSQALGADHRLTLLLESQLSPSNLLGPEQFKMKDRRFESFSRSDRPTDITGNNGIRLRLEDRFTLLRDGQRPVLAIIPFVDLGYTWGQSSLQVAGSSLGQQFLGRTGIALALQPLPGLEIQVDYLTHWGDLRAGASVDNLYVTMGYRAAW